MTEWRTEISNGQVYLVDPNGFTIAQMYGYSWNGRKRKAREMCKVLNQSTHPAPPSRDKVEGLVEQIRKAVDGIVDMSLSLEYCCTSDEEAQYERERVAHYEKLEAALAALSTPKEEGK